MNSDITPADRAQRAVIIYETLRLTRPNPPNSDRSAEVDAELAKGIIIAEAISALQLTIANKR